jgi:RNA polymerase sigma factor (TIGR02999 family)
MPRPEDVTKLLQRWKQQGDKGAEEELFALVQGELLKIARGSLGGHARVAHKIDPAELVNEAYLALRNYPIITSNRAPFFALMAKAMRHVLIDLARTGDAEKRPPTRLRVTDTNALDAVSISSEMGPIDFYRALDSLREINPRQADAIEWRVMGLRNDEIAAETSVAIATVKRDIAKAKAFLA